MLPMDRCEDSAKCSKCSCKAKECSSSCSSPCTVRVKPEAHEGAKSEARDIHLPHEHLSGRGGFTLCPPTRHHRVPQTLHPLRCARFAFDQLIVVGKCFALIERNYRPWIKVPGPVRVGRGALCLAVRCNFFRWK